MKVSILLPLAAVVLTTTAFVVPDEQTIRNVQFEPHAQAPISDEHPTERPVDGAHPHEHVPEHEPSHSIPCHRRRFGGLRPEYVLRRQYRTTPILLDDTEVNFETLEINTDDYIGRYTADGEQTIHDFYRTPGSHRHREAGAGDEWPKPPNWPPKPPNKPEWPPKKPEWPPKPPGKKPEHPPWPPRRPHHPPPHHHKPNETIWGLLSKSNHTTEFVKVVSEFPEFVAILNGTVANYTLFVPTNKAFEKLKPPPGHEKPPKDLIRKFISYHISNDFYPVFKFLLGHTIPSSFISEELGGPQRLRVGLTPHGLAVNWFSRIVAANIFATNGVIHAVDHILLLPPPAFKLLSFLPGQFSTFELALGVTGLIHELPKNHTGGTLFAPTNEAFTKLGPKLNAFLFSPWGRKYLKALLQYHIVYNETLYSDAYYHPTVEEGTLGVPRATGIPKGHYHIDLPTLLKGKHLSIDISRFGGLISIVINGMASIKVQDIIVKDGVIQIPNIVLLPPKKPPVAGESVTMTEAEEIEEIKNSQGDMTVEEFKERFAGLVEEDESQGVYTEEDMLAMWDN